MADGKTGSGRSRTSLLEDRPLRALTICQPYAHLICIGEKRIENRRWRTTYRGPLPIHAGKSMAWLKTYDMKSLAERDKTPMAFGAVVAVAHLVACFRIEEIEEAARSSTRPTRLPSGRTGRSTPPSIIKRSSRLGF